MTTGPTAFTVNTKSGRTITYAQRYSVRYYVVWYREVLFQHDYSGRLSQINRRFRESQ